MYVTATVQMHKHTHSYRYLPINLMIFDALIG